MTTGCSAGGPTPSASSAAGQGQQDAPARSGSPAAPPTGPRSPAGGAACGEDRRPSLLLGPGLPLTQQQRSGHPAEAPAQVSGQCHRLAKPSAPGSYVCAMKVDHRIRCFGDDTFGQVGNDEARGSHSTPVAVAGDPTNWTTLATSENHTCATTQDDRLFCWGHDRSGQLAAPGQDIADRGTPTEVQRNRTDTGAWSAAASRHLPPPGRPGSSTAGARPGGQPGAEDPVRQPVHPAQVLGFTDWADATSLATTCAAAHRTACPIAGATTSSARPAWAQLPAIVGPARVALSRMSTAHDPGPRPRPPSPP